MIIECPACNTRYEIKVELPPEGRTVRCAKCENVWRAVPLEEEPYEEPFEESYASGEGYEAGEEEGTGIDTDAGQQSAGGWGPEVAEEEEEAHAPPFHGYHQAGEEEQEEAAPAFLHGHHQAGDEEQGEAHAPPFHGYHQAGEEEQEEAAPAFLHGYRQAAQMQEDEGFPPAQDPDFASSGLASAMENTGEQEPAAPEASSGKAGWFGSFMRKSQKQAPEAQAGFSQSEPEPMPGHMDQTEPAASDPLQFPRPGPGFAAQTVDRNVRSLDDARAAVRNVFASLGEHRSYQPASSIQAPVTAYGDTEEDGFPFKRPQETAGVDTSGWDREPGEEQNFGHGYGQGTDGSPADGDWPPAGADGEGADTAVPQGWLQDWQPREETQALSENDSDAQLRAALQAHFASHIAPAGAEPDPAPAPEPQFPQEGLTAEDGEAALPEALTAFWQRPLPPPRDETQASGMMPLEDEGEPPVSEIVFDERLFRELEESRELVQQQPRLSEPRGALALAAAWGLFLCVAGGLTAGLFGFREIVADAMPGLAPFYRAMGMPVTVQPVIFEGVHYEWSVADFKPVLHIKGAVYNRAHRGVNVPDLLVSIKDDDPGLDKEIPASLPVEGGSIEPGDRAEFEIELLSPSATITTVELQLRNVR